MRVVVDISQDEMIVLDRICTELKLSRAELIYHAVTQYIQRHDKGWLVDLPGFGCWKDHPEDGLKYQRQIRPEWDR